MIAPQQTSDNLTNGQFGTLLHLSLAIDQVIPTWLAVLNPLQVIQCNQRSWQNQLDFLEPLSLFLHMYLSQHSLASIQALITYSMCKEENHIQQKSNFNWG